LSYDNSTSKWINGAPAAGYTHPNHSGEVTSSADGAQVIADNVVDEANLKVSNSPTNGFMLTAQSGATGGLTWASAGGGGGGGAFEFVSKTTISSTVNYIDITGLASDGQYEMRTTLRMNGHDYWHTYFYEANGNIATTGIQYQRWNNYGTTAVATGRATNNGYMHGYTPATGGALHHAQWVWRTTATKAHVFFRDQGGSDPSLAGGGAGSNGQGFSFQMGNWNGSNNAKALTGIRLIPPSNGFIAGDILIYKLKES